MRSKMTNAIQNNLKKQTMNLSKAILGIVVFTVYSCVSNTNTNTNTNNSINNSTGREFSRDGVSFSFPSDWNISDQEDIDGLGYYLSVEKKGFDESGLVTISWLNGDIGTYEYMEIIKEEYKNQKLLKELIFEPVKNSTFNGIQSISCNFTFNTLGIEHKGIINVFLFNRKTFSVLKQEALEDIAKNRIGFELIESSFKVE